MKLVRTIDELRRIRRDHASRPIGFVPTMGALHTGHLALVGAAKQSGMRVWSSIFVNPLQFGPNEDLARYPRPFERDVELLRENGCELLFAPTPDEITPKNMSVQVSENEISKPLCGEFRPGHFSGVATIVLKLFHIVEPHTAFFGEKDAQQCAVIERLVRDLNVPVTIQRVPTVREADGLAMSSRNRYLSDQERAQAREIFRSFLMVKEASRLPSCSILKLEELGRTHLEKNGFRVQYYEIRESDTLARTDSLTLSSRIFVAAYLGQTRLIDNFELG